jgi:hypothetical protein
MKLLPPCTEAVRKLTDATNDEKYGANSTLWMSFQQGHGGKGLGPHVNSDAHGGARVPL